MFYDIVFIICNTWNNEHIWHYRERMLLKASLYSHYNIHLQYIQYVFASLFSSLSLLIYIIERSFHKTTMCTCVLVWCVSSQHRAWAPGSQVAVWPVVWGHDEPDDTWLSEPHSEETTSSTIYKTHSPKTMQQINE